MRHKDVVLFMLCGKWTASALRVDGLPGAMYRPRASRSSGREATTKAVYLCILLCLRLDFAPVSGTRTADGLYTSERGRRE